MENTNITFFDTFGVAYDNIDTELFVTEKNSLYCEPELCHPLGYILFPHMHLDIMQRIKLAKHSSTIQEFMKVFDVDSIDVLANYFCVPSEDLRCVLENELFFSKMKKILTYIMVCNQAMSHRLYRYESYDEVNSFIKRTQRFYRDCEKFFEIASML